jgi:hypothetical protein
LALVVLVVRDVWEFAGVRVVGLGGFCEVGWWGAGLIGFVVGGCRRGEVVSSVAIHRQEVSARA